MNKIPSFQQCKVERASPDTLTREMFRETIKVATGSAEDWAQWVDKYRKEIETSWSYETLELSAPLVDGSL